MRRLFCIRLVVCLFCMVALAVPQADAQAKAPGDPLPASRFEVYAGYGFLHPMKSRIDEHYYHDISNLNATGSVSYFFLRHLGVTAQGMYFSDNRTRSFYQPCAIDAGGVRRCYHDQDVYSLTGGPVFHMQFWRFVPFVHVMGGALRMNGPVVNPLKNGWDAVGGAGFDFVLPFWHDRLALRPIQADYHYGRIDYGTLTTGGATGGVVDYRALHASAGLVLRLGSKGERVTQELSCSADPAIAYPGDPVHLSAMISGVATRHLYFEWQAPGLQGDGDGASALDLSTANLAPGQYPVNVKVEHERHGKPIRTCSTSFQVHAWEPPTVSCSVQPSSVALGESVNVVALGRSPQNRPLTYSFSTTGGMFSGNGSSVQLQTSGLQPGQITVACNVVDDQGQKATATAVVTVAPPTVLTPVYPSQPQGALPATGALADRLPPVAQQETLCSISFERDRRRPTRVDNEAKACLDSVALSMSRDAYTRLVIVGTYTSRESRNTGEARALHAKQYMTEEKGIDPAAIDTEVKRSSTRSAENVLLPSGAIFDEPDAVTFDPGTVHLTGEAYGHRRPRR